MRLKRTNRRLLNLMCIIVIAGALVVMNVLFTMFTHKHLWSQENVLQALNGTDIYKTTTTAQRGTIYDRNGEVIAQDKTAYTIIAYLDEDRELNGEPAYVVDITDTAEKLADVLGGSVKAENLVSTMEEAKKNGRTQTELGTGTKRISKEKMEEIQKLDLPGIDFLETSDRDYPTGVFASHLIGFASYDEDEQKIIGKMGLEYALNDYLTGEDGWMQYQRAADGTELPGTRYVGAQAVDGNDVYLTLDSNVQSVLETSLQTTMKSSKCESAWGLVVEVETGKILGWGSYPTFDMNKHDITQYLNMASDNAYEPGSVMKGITYAASVDSGTYPYNQTYRAKAFNYTYDEETGKITRTSQKTVYPTITDAQGKDYGTLTFDEGFVRSSNVGICCLLADYLPAKTYEEYLERFGFFKSVDIPFVSNVTGVKNFSHPSDILSTGFGQSSSVTALQMVQAYTAIFNDGVMVRPYVVDRIVDSYNNETIQSWTTEEVGQPISAETSEYMRKLMARVVSEDYGTGHRYQLDDIDVIAKTGTGQIAGEHGYTDSKYTSSVMMAAPADDPKVMLYYVFVSNDIINFNDEPIKNVFKEALVSVGVTGDSENITDKDNSDSWESYATPSLVNHSLSYVNEKLKKYDVETVMIGDGNSIVAQYPNADEPLTSNDRLLLLTDGTSYTMPNMIGWTRKDVDAFCELSGISINIEGNGKVSSQSVKKGTSISAESEITVKMK